MISIIVPVYKVAPYLRQCVDSIIGQTYRDLEILLIDDGSPDECGEICEEYKRQDKRIIVYHTMNNGLSAARNVGLKAATGEYLGFIDSDDWIEPDMYESLMNRLEETGADISTCGFWFETVSHHKMIQFDETVFDGTDALRALLYANISSCTWNKLYRREVFWDVLFPEGKNYEDIAVMHRVLNNAGRIATIGERKYHYRTHSGSITKTNTAENILDFADAQLVRYRFFKDEKKGQFSDDEIKKIAAKGISKVWRWWYGCDANKKRKYRDKIVYLKNFSREQFPLFGYRSWPVSLRISTLFMHSSSMISFAVLYGLNQTFRKVWPEKSNTI